MPTTKRAQPVRSLLTAVAVAAGIASVPLAVWLLSGRSFLPALDDHDPLGTLAAGQVPAGAIPWLSAVVVWLCWFILVTIFVVEFVAVAAGRDRDVSGVRGGAKKLAEYILRLQLATAVIPAGVTAAPPPIVVVDDAGDQGDNRTIDDSVPEYFNYPLDETDGQNSDGQDSGDQDIAGQGTDDQNSDGQGSDGYPGTVGAGSDGLPGVTDGGDSVSHSDAATTDAESSSDAGAVTGEVYTVKKGDTLWDIAETYYGDGEGVRYPEIWEASDLVGQHPPLDPTNPDLIYPGNTFVVPANGQAPVAPAEVEPDPPLAETGPDRDGLLHKARNEIPPDAPPPYVPAEVAPQAPITSEVNPPRTANRSPVPESGNNTALLAAVAFVGLAGSAAALVMRGVLRKRREGLDASSPNQRRSSRRERNAQRVEASLQARAGHELWPVEDLQRCWNALNPVDAGNRQLWVSRFNRRDDQLEGSWTRADHEREADAPIPAPNSPWSLQPRQRPDGSQVNVWRVGRNDIPPAHSTQPNAVPLMAAVGGDVFVNLDAVSSLSLESQDLERPAAGVIRSLQRQLVGQPVDWVTVGDAMAGVTSDRHYVDVDQACQAIQSDLDRAGDTWDSYESLHQARQDGATGRTTVVVGDAEELQRSSLLLSIADTANLPVTVIAVGSLPAPFATITLSANDADVIAVAYSSRSIQLGVATYLTVDEMSILEGATPVDWTNNPPPQPARTVVDPSLDTSIDTPIGAAVDPATAPATDESQPWAGGALSGSRDQPPPATTAVPPIPVTKQTQDLNGQPGEDQQRLRFRPANVGDDPIVTNPKPGFLHLDDPVVGSRPGEEAEPGDVALAVVGASQGGHEPSGDLSADAWFAQMDPYEAPEPTPVADDDDLSWAMGLSEAAAADIFARTADDLATENGRLAELAAGVSDTTDRLADDPDPDPDSANHQPARSDAPATGPFGVSGLRLELAGPIRLLQDRDGQTVDVSFERPITAQLLSLVAYLGFKTVTSNGVSPSEVLNEFWPVSTDDPNSLFGDTSKASKRVTAARKALEALVGDHFTLITPATNGAPYQLVDITIDLDELDTVRQEQRNGDLACGELIETAHRLLGGPALLTLPAGVRPKNWRWVDEVEAAIHNIIRQLTDMLISCASNVDDLALSKTALAVAENVHGGFMADLATAWVEHHMIAGEHVDAEAVVARYEAKSLHSGESRPRRRLDELRARQDQHADSTPINQEAG